ncbi:MAG: hypothetical protein Q9225_002870 [Loekoesia sp. 1 TL-2023]
MAAPLSQMAHPKPSFASVRVAAMAPPTKQPVNSAGLQENGHRTTASLSAKAMGNAGLPLHQPDRKLQDSMADLTVRDGNPTLRSVVTTELSSTIRPGLRFDDEQTHVSASSTKPGSLDGKSTASGATFAMDEKESLRPDDSASVKAADEDDSYSGNGSGAPNSHVGSEASGRAFRDQFHEISERIGHVPGRSTVTGHQGIPDIEEEAVHGAASPLQPPLQTSAATAGTNVVPANGPFFQMEYRSPDEKLLEALESAKDRLFVLRLEQDIINFIQQSRDQTLDLRTPNSFCRLLAHKLGDYYALTHHVDGSMSAVKLYRTPYCRIRTPLSTYSQANPINDNQPSTQPTMKIMRRAGLAKDGSRLDSGPDTTASSMAPSKAGSETGDDSGRVTGLVSPTESNLGKDRLTMTREEREAKYKETRDRIFKGFEDTENTDIAASNDAALGMSRSSSVNGKRKTRKQRNVDDGFEARSHYTAYYPTMQYARSSFDQTPASPAYFNPGIPQHYPTLGDSNGMGPTTYPSSYGSGYQSMPNTQDYPVPIQQYPMTNSSTSNGFNHMLPYPSYVQQQLPYQYYQQPQPSPALGQYSPAMSSPTISGGAQLSRPQSQTSDQQWPQVAFQYPYQQPRNQQQFYPPPNPTQNPMSGPQTVPYQYGQLPYPSNLHGSRNAHPLPGSYNRQQALNPQIRSFVPSSSSQPSFVGNPSQEALSSYQLPNTGGNTPGLPSNGSSDLPGPISGMPQFGSFTPTSEPKSMPSRKSQSNPAENHTPVKSTLAKWGTPANLPPKPPPPDPPSIPEGRHSLPQSVPAPASLPKMSNGQHISAFQNGL